ncbi:hypothetical protein M409DRAFT_30462 [Zasmidium cellare ATCC 36951]|uniref:Small ribosomal subunit protein mS29 n=1 Tax=Zasmidium cellare ATCC 36951 TaxID=1080233 RepID=A0A6A6BWT4_ZASCE|nr:uncharacterized protein M409DRAFT_30462 [Zasmidium cellare ATCC 36951]KAF2159043.1 hypothetical protein M409DRAFT_30462 [Zasmidium cellare ATCC 36951]
MASLMCPRCLRRSFQDLEITATTVHPQRAAFSTSAPLSVNPPKKKAVVAKPSSRQGRSLRLTKNTRASNTRPPAVGERKALRKRVVLSNTNALEVPGLQDLSKQNLSSRTLQALEGTVVGFNNTTVDKLRALEAFKPTQGWNLFRRPASLVRKDTTHILGDIEWVKAGQESRTVRKVLYGERGSGKSVLLLQALAMASLKGWVVVHIPEAMDLTIAHTSYQPVSTPDGKTRYVQPHFTAKILENVLNANRPLLEKLRLSGKHKIPVQIQPDATLARLAEIGAKDPDRAWPVWQALWKELTTPSQQGEGLSRPPIMFTLDAIDHIMRISAYLNAEAEPIHAHDLLLPGHFIELLSGREPLSNGGIILGAVSESNRAASHTLDHAVSRNAAIQNEQEPPAWDPYVKYDKNVQEAMQGVGVQRLQGLSKEEARGIMEYYAHSGMLRNAVTDGLVSERWTLAGGGIIGQIEKGTVKARF